MPLFKHNNNIPTGQQGYAADQTGNYNGSGMNNMGQDDPNYRYKDGMGTGAGGPGTGLGTGGGMMPGSNNAGNTGIGEGGTTGHGHGLGHHTNNMGTGTGTGVGAGNTYSNAPGVGAGNTYGNAPGVGNDPNQNPLYPSSNAPMSDTDRAAMPAGTHAGVTTGTDAHGNPQHPSQGTGGMMFKGKVEHAVGSLIGSDSMRAKGIALEEQATAMKAQAAELSHAERLEKEALARRERAVAHGAHPGHGNLGGHNPGAGATNANELGGAGYGVTGAGGAGSTARGGY